MSARHSHRWLAWLLPLFLLRAVVPVGFMLSWSDAAGLQIVMCSGSGPLPLPLPADVSGVDAVPHHGESQAHGGSHAMGVQHEHNRADNAAMCPFAVAGTSGALPSFEAVVAFVATVSQQARELSALDVPTPRSADRPHSRSTLRLAPLQVRIVACQRLWLLGAAGRVR